MRPRPRIRDILKPGDPTTRYRNPVRVSWCGVVAGPMGFRFRLPLVTKKRERSACSPARTCSLRTLTPRTSIVTVPACSILTVSFVAAEAGGFQFAMLRVTHKRRRNVSFAAYLQSQRAHRIGVAHSAVVATDDINLGCLRPAVIGGCGDDSQTLLAPISTGRYRLRGRRSQLFCDYARCRFGAAGWHRCRIAARRDTRCQQGSRCQRDRESNSGVQPHRIRLPIRCSFHIISSRRRGKTVQGIGRSAPAS